MMRINPNTIQGTYGLPINKSQNSAKNSDTQANPVAKEYVMPQDNRLDFLKDRYGEKALKQMGLIECATCASRTYVDGSNDPGVSFKSPAHISPEASFAMVSSHEQEHVTNERARAQSENREVISQSVQIFSSVCPECGKHYASGGVTRTTTGAKATSAYSSQVDKGDLMDAKV